MAKYLPERANVNDGLYFYGFAKADTFVRAMYKAGKNPTRAGLMRALLSFNETTPYLLPGSRLKTARDRPLHHLAPAAERTSAAPGRGSGPLVDGGRAASPRAKSARIVGAGDGPHVVHGLHPHPRAGADPRVGAGALRARARASRPRLGRGRGAAALARRHPRRGGLPRCRSAGGARRRRARLRLVLPALRGARQGRLVGARDRLGLERPLRQDGREVGDGRAAAGAAAAAGERRRARLLRAHRARLRLRRGRARNPGGT